MIRAAAVGTLIILLPLKAQDAGDRALVEAEQARETGVPALLAGLKGGARSQMLAARAIGRLENPAYRDALIPLLGSADPQVRRAAAGAVAQIRAPFAWAATLKAGRDGSVRAAIFEAVGRAKPPDADAESTLAGGLKDAEPQARAGAARGLESLFRLNSKPPRQAATSTLAALHEAFTANRDEQIRELILLTMHAAGDHDSATLAGALADPNAQVRRLAVVETHKWVSGLIAHGAVRSASHRAFV